MNGQKIKDVLTINDLCDINTRRECILRSLVIYLSEDPDSFFKAYLASGTEDVERGISSTVMGIYMIRGYDNGEAEDVGIVIEGIKVLNNVGSVIMGFIVLIGLIYGLDPSFPENLKYTFVLPENHNKSGWTQAQSKDTAAENQIVFLRSEHQMTNT